MISVSEMGGIILPPVMAFYHQPKNISDLVDQVVGKVLDLLKVPHELFKRWKDPAKN
jgi:4-hydroxy-3-polyprenylbenzoate decarboxylase